MHSIIVQGVGFLALALLLVSFQCKDSRKLFYMQLLANTAYLLHFLLMGAYSACFSLFISCVRNLVLVGKGSWARWIGWPWLLVAANLAAAIATWEDGFSILPCIGVVSLTLAGWTRNGKKVRLANLLIAAPAWLIYDFHTGSYSGMLCELLSMGSVIVSVMRYGWKTLDTVGSSDS